VSSRLALLDMPGLLVDVVREAFADAPDLEIDVLAPGSGLRRLLECKPDVAMIGVADPEHYPSAELLLRQRPNLGLVAISLDARRAWIHGLRPCARPLLEVSSESLRAAAYALIERGRA
jgi:hypothetical protein